MRSAILIVSCLCVACSPRAPDSSVATGADAAVPVVAKKPEPAPAPKPEPKAEPKPEPPFADGVRSLELKRSIAVRMRPEDQSDRYGTIAAGTRVAWKRVIEAEGCDKRWVEIEPYGWVCEVYLRPSEHAPRGVEVPRLQREEIVPGVYGKVIAEEPKTYHQQAELMVEARALEGSVMVRQYGATIVEEIEYWRITQRGKKEYLPKESLREYRPSTFQGARLSDDTGLQLPVGFPLSRERVSAKVPVFSAATGGHAVGRVPGREPLAVLEIARNAKGAATAYRVGDKRWVRADQMRVAQAAPMPPYTGATERWLDIDLDEQVLVAYEGEVPAYVTLVATGSSKHPTETGIYRIWVKFSEKNMSDLAGEDPYSVATVPWAQFYEKDFALHTSYWHDTFGTRRSHGCTNLSPQDARFLYFWSEPQVPPGWSMANGTIEHPGSLVRLHNKADPEPAFQGYAARVYESRKSQAEREESWSE